VTLFDDLLSRVFDERLADHLPMRVLPIGTEPPQDFQTLVDREYLTIVELRKRQAKSAATRKRIIEAATAEFTANGYHGTPMATIAARAGVAVPTVYFVFHTKPELFAAALDTAVLGPEARAPLEQRWARDATAVQSDPVAALQSFIRGSAPIFLRASALSEVAGAAAPTDPDLADVYQSREKLRVEAYRDFVKMLALPAGVDADRATDILITMLSPQLYLAWRDGRHWSHEEIIHWMAGTIPELMLRTT
jgi:AcrR family transcriptional regulator